MAMASGVAAIPFVGSTISKGTKLAFKGSKYAAQAAKAAGYIKDISKLMGYTGMATLGAINTAYAYQDYKSAKANGGDASEELYSLVWNAISTYIAVTSAASCAAKVAIRLNADGVGNAVKAAEKNAMSGNKGSSGIGVPVGSGRESGRGIDRYVASAGQGNGGGGKTTINDGLGDLDWTNTDRKGKTALDHVQKHAKPNYQREMHGVFRGDVQTIIEDAWGNRANAKVVSDGMGGTIYNIPYQNVGYNTGYINFGKQMDYVTIVVQEGTSTVWSAFPSYGDYRMTMSY